MDIVMRNVIVEKDQVIATGTSLENKIFSVFVSPDRQGQGYGKTIMAALEERVLSQGYDKVLIDMSIPSTEFYRALGYCITGETLNEVGGGSTFKCFNAEKVLMAL